MTGVTLLGLGEVGRVLAEGMGPIDGVRLTSWDTAYADPASRASRHAAELGISQGADAASSVASVDVVFSAVTAANTLAAAESVAAGLAGGEWFVDLNSASPGQKQAAAAVIEAAGGRYVEAAVMSPIHPKRLAAPILLGGRHAVAFEVVGQELGWTGLRVYSGVVGPAAATKLSRSVVVKGFEALVMEAMLTARAWGVEDEVLGSLSNVIPAEDWPALAAYLVSRSVEHGTRRAEEMREAARTVAETGATPLMATATAERQAWAAQFADTGSAQDPDDPEGLFALIDRMRATS
jgi:3-hydroxyisobutyrate dehydrogenase-like beta-hydroxyacid dehydrogenase